MEKLLHALCMIGKYYLYGFLIQMLFLPLIYAAPSNAQGSLDIKQVHLSLDLEDVSLEETFSEIMRLTEFSFIYDDRLLEGADQVSIQIKDQTLETVLLSLSSSHQLAFKQVDDKISVKFSKSKDRSRAVLVEVTVTGTVVDANGDPIPGVTVFVPGTNSGTATDMDGKYSIVVPEGSSLVFSFIGFESQTVEVGNQTTINITMEQSAQALDEVIVLGYGTQKKSELTNAVVQTSGEEVKKSSAVSLSNALSGRLAGLYVNQRSAVPGFDDAQILVRGFNTTRNNSALIVIDGVANADPDGLNRLDPNDIESISVLKDASAAIYGAQSAGGVILVTTKRGKTGKPSFNFSTSHLFQSPTMKVKSAGVFDYMDVLNRNRVLEGGGAVFPDDLVESFRNGSRRAEDWWDALVDPPAIISRQSLTMRGGSDRIRYFTSVGMVNQGGILRADDITKLKQYNVRANLDVTVTDDLEVGIDLSIRQKFTQSPQGGSGAIGAFASTSPLQEAYIGGDYRYPGEGWSHLNPAARLLSPGYRRNTGDVANGTFRYNYKIPFVEGLSVDGFASIVKTFNYNKSFDYVWDYYERNSEGVIVKRTSRTVEDIGLREDFNQSTMITLNSKIAYDRVIKTNHRVSGFIAYEQMTYDDNFFWAQRLGFDSPQIDQLFAGSENRSQWNNSGGASENARQNYFGRLNYEFSNKYLFGFNFRYDGSPIFPKETRWGFFPGLSAGWVVSEEAFMSDNLFSNLKLRASWGKLGNDRVDPFQYIGRFGYGPGWVVNGADVRGIAALTTPNPNITWEVSESTDIGLELGFLQDRLTFETDVYRTYTTNILGRRQASIPGYTGLILPDENIGEMKSHGIEFQLGFREHFGQVNYRVSANYSYNDNEIIFFDEVPQAEPYQNLEGMPIGSELVYNAIGIYRTQDDLDSYVSYPNATLGSLIFNDLNNDGVIDGNDRYRYNINAFPRSQFGMTIGLDYKNFDLTMLLQGQDGGKFRLDNGFDTGANGNGLAYVANNTYDLENTDAILPRIRPVGFAAQNNDFWYHNARWVRFKSAELGYNLPGPLMDRIGISGLRVYLSGENLFMIYNNLAEFGAGDPEFLSGKGGTYPNMRTLGFGLNLSF
ncbi:SusC/RagA family TonB-linked outer membrane protein [Cyclobacterium plantarum]|uniref:TonB-dependent receptor n=1 Tax=Cyclobacterium plantarum TaxID=2716263 RepID=A0ABX0HHP0_9BACT|nr:TonB-dependent receptor [Cyclobacterium plantarum]NHE59570.1 TonB-dependent receptor [Cyclobacterium plantarum]